MIKRIILVFVLILLPFSTFATAGMWSFETIDSADEVGAVTSLALDSQETPHIAYYDITEKAVKYINLKSRSAQIVATFTYQANTWISLGIDTTDTPHIVYYDYEYSKLKHAKLEGSTWTLIDVDTGNVGQYNSLVLDSNNYPHISYYDAARGDLKYAKWTGSAWVFKRVDGGYFRQVYPWDYIDTGNVGKYTSIALDSSGYPHISYYDVTNQDLKYAMWTGTEWKTKPLDQSGTASTLVGLYTSIAIDSNNYVHISYQYDDGATKQYLMYIKLKDTIEVSERIDQTAGYVGFYTSIAVDSNGRPHISYYDQTSDPTNGNLQYARYLGNTSNAAGYSLEGQFGTGWKIKNNWFIQTVDTTGDVGKFSSIALDNRNCPHISYYDVTGRDLEYATIP